MTGGQQEGQVYWDFIEAGSVHAVRYYGDSLPNNNQKAVLTTGSGELPAPYPGGNGLLQLKTWTVSWTVSFDQM